MGSLLNQRLLWSFVHSIVLVPKLSSMLLHRESKATWRGAIDAPRIWRKAQCALHDVAGSLASVSKAHGMRASHEEQQNIRERSIS